MKLTTRVANEHYLNAAIQKEISDSKVLLLRNQQSGVKIDKLGETVKQVYYRPKQLYYCTD